ncbi:MAG: hypothetical protein ACFFBD_12075 [Candidatus Hodarchaeota archaeon]
MGTSTSKDQLQPVCQKNPNYIRLDLVEADNKELKIWNDLIIKIRRLLKPDWRKIFVFLGFMILTLGAMIQSYAFSEVGTPPPGYELLRPFPIWVIWVYTLFPMLPLLSAFSWISWIVGYNNPLFLTLRSFFYPISILVYYYFFSCLIIAFIDKEMGGENGKAGLRDIYHYFFKEKA